MGSVAGHTALVTGAASGIGLATAKALAREGAKVHVVDMNADAATAAANEIGGTAHVADLADFVVTDLPAEIDILVNNAGLQHLAPIHEFPLETFVRMQQVMVTAAFQLTKHVLPHMYARGWGRLIHISSAHGHRASAFKSAYTAAKHAVEGFSKAAALEGAPHGVTSNCVAPGYVRTPLVENQVAAQAKAHGIDEDQVRDQIFLQRSAIKRLIEPDEVASAVLWLCEAGFVTGTSLSIDGGWTAQ